MSSDLDKILVTHSKYPVNKIKLKAQLKNLLLDMKEQFDEYNPDIQHIETVEAVRVGDIEELFNQPKGK